MEDMRNRVEAVLFITGNFLGIEEIAQHCGIGSVGIRNSVSGIPSQSSEGIVKEAIDKLREEYRIRDTSLEILEENNKFKLALRKEFVSISARLLSSTELDRSTQETLAIIAYKQPILQSDLIKVRGNGAYDHIHLLKEREFITSEKHGRTRLIKVAQKFYEYFDIADDATLKQKCTEIEQKVGVVQQVASPDKRDEQAALEKFNNQKEKEGLQAEIKEEVKEEQAEEQNAPAEESNSNNIETDSGEEEEVNNQPGEVQQS